MSFELEAIRIETKDFPNHRISKACDLTSSAFDSVVIKADDGFFTTASSILDRPKDNDKDVEQCCIIKLGCPGTVVGVDIDTSHSSLELVSVEGAYDNASQEGLDWFTLLNRVKLTALDHNLFVFKDEPAIVCTHIRITKHAKGNIEHFSLYGFPKSKDLHENTIPSIQAEPLNSEAYAPYGDVIDTTTLGHITQANQGTAEKYHHIASVTNNFPKKNGKMNLCIYHCRPAQPLPFVVKLLERHPYSSQAFVPMTDRKTRGYLVIVALNGVDDRPDLSTLRAFVANSKQGINYHQGVWHHPMVVLEDETDFVCLVHESGVPEEDCHEVDVSHTLIHVPGL
ncbi:ureidoglycolate hydrolase-domain-containing protein [Blakeslea trispora]|nr:ureidoglycolate hydrolase-domain-containing protein [Blakeslea trispora]